MENFYYAIVADDEEIGLYANAIIISGYENLVGKFDRYKTVMPCKTLKEAKNTANNWNKSFVNNGSQKLIYTSL